MLSINITHIPHPNCHITLSVLLNLNQKSEGKMSSNQVSSKEDFWLVQNILRKAVLYLKSEEFELT
jgi:hypothetical protein